MTMHLIQFIFVVPYYVELFGRNMLQNSSSKKATNWRMSPYSFCFYKKCRLHLQRGEAILFQSEGYFHSESSENWHSEPCWNKTHADEIKHIH